MLMKADKLDNFSYATEEIILQYEFEIRCSEESKTEVRVAIMFEEEQIAPVLYLHKYAQKHFGDLGPNSLGDRLELHRRPVDDRAGSGETLLCSAAYNMVDGVPTILMIAGPLVRQTIYGHA